MMLRNNRGMTARLKLQEAAVFLELMHALQLRGESLTNCADASREASFLFSAVMNAFYSAVEILRANGVDTKAFRLAHPEVYADGSKGGMRARTVHLAHVDTSHSGYIPPPGDQVNMYLRPAPKLVPDLKPEAGKGVHLVFRAEHYVMIELLGRQVQALDFCTEQYGHLAGFLDSVGA